MGIMPIITQERLKELLHYDPDTGVFTRRVATNNRAKVGGVAGNTNTCGYVQVGVDHTRHYAHRLAFLYMTGELPPDVVDHINGVKDDNRWCNLRLATQGENMQNLRGPRSDSTSYLLGVSWHKRRKKWAAEIYVNKVKRNLGYFQDKHEAHAAYLKAKAELHPFSTLKGKENG